MGQQSATELLIRLKDGENGIYDQLYPIIYDELRQVAYQQVNRQKKDFTLSKTELVHEAYLKMIDQNHIDFENKVHFLAIASRCMRHIIIDYVRKKTARKRGGVQPHVTYVDEIYEAQNREAEELIAINDKLEELQKLNERLSKVVEMRFFGEMSVIETAAALAVSESTVKRDWALARGWLYKELNGRFKLS